MWIIFMIWRNQNNETWRWFGQCAKVTERCPLSWGYLHWHWWYFLLCFLTGIWKRQFSLKTQTPFRNLPMTWEASVMRSGWRKLSAPSVWCAVLSMRTQLPSSWATAGSWSGNWSLPCAVEMHGTGEWMQRLWLGLWLLFSVSAFKLMESYKKRCFL